MSSKVIDDIIFNNGLVIYGESVRYRLTGEELDYLNVTPDFSFIRNSCQVDAAIIRVVYELSFQFAVQCYEYESSVNGSDYIQVSLIDYLNIVKDITKDIEQTMFDIDSLMMGKSEYSIRSFKKGVSAERVLDNIKNKKFFVLKDTKATLESVEAQVEYLINEGWELLTPQTDEEKELFADIQLT
jgi:hypothetical protein